MSAALVEQVASGIYLTDGKRLVMVELVSSDSILVEDALTLETFDIDYETVSKRWRRIEHG